MKSPKETGMQSEGVDLRLRDRHDPGATHTRVCAVCPKVKCPDLDLWAVALQEDAAQGEGRWQRGQV